MTPRRLFLFALVVIACLITRTYLGRHETRQPLQAPASPQPRAIPATAALPAPPKSAGTRDDRSANNGSVSSRTAPTDPDRHEEGTSQSPDMSAQKEGWFSFYRTDFGAHATELEGEVTLAYQGYGGKFTIHLLLPPQSFEGGDAVPIFLADKERPSINSLGTAALERARAPGEVSVVRFVGNSIHPFFTRVSSSEERPRPSEEPSQITTVMFSFDPAKGAGQSFVDVRFAYETDGPTTNVGKLKYVLARKRSTS